MTVSAAQVAYSARMERKDTEDDTPITGAEFKKAFSKFQESWKEFQTKNDQRISEVEKKGVSDVVLTEHVDRINASITEQQEALDKFIAEQKRVPIGNDKDKKELTEIEKKHVELFDSYIRGSLINEGEIKASQKAYLEEKAMSVGDATMGGFVTPIEHSYEMDRLVTEISPIRGIAQVQQISTGLFQKPFNLTGTASGWVSETGARPQTANPVLDELSFPTHELYAMPAATQTLLDDSAINVEEWLAGEVRTEFAKQEGAAFVNGSGVGQPKGFLSYPTVEEDATDWSWGKLGYFATGTASGFSANEADDLIDLVYLLKAEYRSNARWTMNRKTQGAVRKIKDAEGNYLWQPALIAGQPAVLLGYGITEAEDMPDITVDNSYPVAFGDFRRGYLVVDRIGVRVLRDPFSSKPYVLFYTTKRVGGGVQNFEAIKLLKIED